jgi:hypothetical protein
MFLESIHVSGVCDRTKVMLKHVFKYLPIATYIRPGDGKIKVNISQSAMAVEDRNRLIQFSSRYSRSAVSMTKKIPLT